MAIKQIPYTGELPESFFAIGAKPYRQLGFGLEEDPDFTRRLFALEADRNRIVFFTDDQDLRLVGIFPKEGGEAFFGFWETNHDLAKNHQAFALLEAEACRLHFRQLAGPINFNTFHRYRLRLGVPTWLMFDREPVNPLYYPKLLAQLGFTVRSTFESRLIKKETVPELYLDKQQFLQQLEKIPFDFIPVNRETWVQYEDEIFELVQAIFSRNPAYKPVSQAQFRLLYNAGFADQLCPASSVLFRDKISGRFAALSFCPPNYKPLALPPAVPPVFAGDFPRLPRKTLLAKTVGVHPDFRRQGLMSYLAAYAMFSFRERYAEVLFCLMRADNFSTHFTNGLPYEAVQYALYHKRLQA
jgi:GNAT superfamily N-acetyltransferase